MKNKKRLLILVICFSLVFSAVTFAADNTRFAKIIAYDVNIRAGSSTEQPVIAHAQYGDTFQVLSVQNGWYQVKLDNNHTGWISSALVTEGTYFANATPTIAREEQQKGTVIADTLNVRSDKSENAPVLGTLKQGDIAQVVNKSNGWTQITFQGQTGYVKSEFIRLQGDPTAQAKQPVQTETSNSPTLTLSDATNIRSGPGTNFTLVQTGATGDTFPITAKSGQWLQIALPNDKKGWVAGWLVQVNGSTDQVPEQKQSLDNSLQGKTIVLDPGHGGFDTGAIGRSTGLYEKDAALSLSRILYNKLLTTGATVIMTRTDDHFVSLADRVNISEQNHADLFVSLHYNTNPDPNLSGTITYYYNENGADHQLANLVEKDVVQSLGLPNLGTRFGDFYVLRNNPQTAILIETAFLTNARDEQMAENPMLEEKAAEGIFQALVSYLQGQ